MTNSSDRARTGYFNALTSGYFKTARDGRKLFYPWGAMGRGYTIPSQEAYDRLHGRIKIYQLVSLVAIVGAVVVKYYLAAFIIAGLSIAFYRAWTPYLVRGLQPSDERLSMQESMATQARAHGAVGLWLLEIVALMFVATGVVMLVVAPDKRLIALTSIVFFGACAAAFAHMLVLCRHTPGGRS
jgi:hypothetical protein